MPQHVRWAYLFGGVGEAQQDAFAQVIACQGLLKLVRWNARQAFQSHHLYLHTAWQIMHMPSSDTADIQAGQTALPIHC